MPAKRKADQPPPAPASQPEPDPKTAELLTWLRECGAEGLDDLHIRPDRLGGLCVFARRIFAAGDRIASVPQRCVLSARAAEQSQLGKAVRAAAAAMGPTCEALVMEEVHTYVPGPPYCTYGLRVPASRVPYVPKAQGSSLPRAATAVRTLYAYRPLAFCTYAYRGTPGLPLGDNQRTVVRQVTEEVLLWIFISVGRADAAHPWHAYLASLPAASPEPTCWPAELRQELSSTPVGASASAALDLSLSPSLSLRLSPSPSLGPGLGLSLSLSLSVSLSVNPSRRVRAGPSAQSPRPKAYAPEAEPEPEPAPGQSSVVSRQG